ncbi:Ig-like domain repeat protein [Methanobrevibacter sp.]|uniref:Ig-like domain repeat protein n=1 Tax=Methanobrevibacter sp. TaxID=66852 RepID=UPI00388D9A52
MRSYKKYLLLGVLLFFIVSMGSVSASELNDTAVNQISDDLSQDIEMTVDDEIVGSSEEIVVENWDDLQYYCSLDDNNYVLKLKENTSYYPTDLTDESYQIKVNNNVTIIGSEGAYFGDSSPNARTINYLAINVPEYSGIGITLKDITFKWISSEFQPNAGFLQMAGNANNYIDNCIFDNITMTGGHSSVVYLLRGDVTLSNCSFTNITSDFGVFSLYDPKDDPTDICTHARGLVQDCYFEGNFARTEPGCINNCGVLVVRNSTFYRNAAFWWAGAIHTHGGANTTIYDSNFTDNTAGWNGGALYTYSYLQIFNTVFKGNNCTTNNGGGAIGACKYLHSPYIHVEDSLFENNENLCWAFTNESTTGLGRGGAISIMDEGDLTVLNTTFIKNSASIGTAICAISQGSLYGSPDVTLIGNRFINHTRVEDVLVLKLDYNSKCELRDNYYLANSMIFSKLKLTAEDRIGDEVTLHIDAALKYPNYYDSDILEKSGYDVYMDGVYLKTVNSTDFTLNLKNVEKAQVYVVPSISTSQSNEVSVGLPREYIYVSQKSGSDSNNGSKESPVSTIAKAVELARTTGNIWIVDGTFKETNLNVNYNLSITGEDATFSSKGNIFTFGDVDVELKNIVFKNSKQASSSSERIIKHSSGILTLENCTFDSNTYNTLIETGGSIESSNLEFVKNNGILIQANNYVIDSSAFVENTADSTKTNALIKSSLGFKTAITNSIFSNNIVKEGCIYFKALDKSKLNTLLISDCIFTNNVGNDGSSGIYMYDNGILDLKSSLFLNNTDSGKNGALILTSTEIHIADSIFLGNVYENNNKVLFNSKSSTNLKNIYVTGNWFGNTQENYNSSVPVSSSSHCDNWLFLNVSANTTSMFLGESAQVYFNLNNAYTNEGNITYWDSGNLPTVRLSISTTGGKSDQKEVTLVYGMAQAEFTLNEAEATLTASYESVRDVINFTEARQKPEMTVTVTNISVDNDETITIKLSGDATGSLTVKVGNITETKDITGGETVFTLSDLASGDYSGTVTYSGDEYYSKVVKDIYFSVNKYNSTTTLSVGQIEVGRDVILTVNVTPGATGNITLIINNKEETLTLTDSKATYTLSSISRGDYDIQAIYNGDYKYVSSKDSAKFEVDKLDTAIHVSVEDIVYGQDAVVKIILDESATGNVTVSINGDNKTSVVENGQAILTVSKLDSGEKTVDVYYSGDNIFKPNTNSTSFNVAKDTTPLNINVNSIMIGHDASIEVTVKSGVTGSVTISYNNQSTTKSIPRTGRVLLTVSDLAVGTYDVSAVLESENYETVENNISFTVSDFEVPQWSNEGYDTQNTGKSPYDSEVNGEILWQFKISGEVVGNIAIDSNGNVYIITSKEVFAINKDGKLVWNRTLNGDGNLSGISIGRDVLIIPQAGNTLNFINQTTGEKYGNSNIYLGSSYFEPVVDSNGNVFISSEYIYASEDYKLIIVPYRLWEKGGNPAAISLAKSRPISAPVILENNLAIVACDDSIKIIDLTNNQILSSVKGNTQGIRPVIGPGNMIYAVLDNNIVEISPQGGIIWKTSISDGAGKYLALDDESGLYLINANGKLYKYDLVDGSETLVSNLTFTLGILVGNDGTVYVGSNDMFYAFDSEGKALWKSYIGSEIIGTPVMDKNGIIYISTADGLIALTNAPLKDPKVNIDVQDVKFGENVTVIITVDNQSCGDLTIQIDDDSSTQSIKDQGIITKTLTGLQSGVHTVKVTYGGDLRFNAQEVSSNFTVKKLQTDLIVHANNITVGETAIINVSILDDVDGNVLVDINGKTYKGTVKNGECVISVPDLEVGNYTVTAQFSSDNYEDCINTTSFAVSKVIVPPSNETIDIVVPESGEASSYSISLPSDATGTLTVTIDGVNYTATLIDGKATVNVPKLAEGSHNITVAYSGDDKYSPIVKSTTVVVHVPVIKLAGSNLSMLYTSGKYYKVRLTKDGNGFANQTVKITINGKTYTRTTDANGYASLKISFIPKTYTVKAVYGTLKATNKVVVKSIVAAKNVNAKKSAKSIKIKVTLKKVNGKYLKSKKLTLKFNKKTFKAKTNKKGVATFTIKKNVYNKLKVGKKYTYQVTYLKNKVKKTIKFKK